MDVKPSIEEKRVKSTVIRRRAKAEPPPAPVVVPLIPVMEEAATLSRTQAAVAGESSAITPAGATASVSVAGEKPATTTTEKIVRKGEAPIPEAAGRESAVREKPKKLVKRKTRDELDMEMIERAGGLKKAAELMEVAPERLERVFRPDRNAKKKRVVAKKEFRKTEITTPKAIKRVVRIETTVTVGDLARRMGIKAAEVLKKLMGLGLVTNINQSIDHDTAMLVAQEFGYEVEDVAFAEETILDREKEKDEGGEKFPRPPIVTVMGHVDHGKTSLLDAIRKTHVAAGEAGGITQHIGAYDVKIPKGIITFIDTPGHEAFTAMRARGAQVTDIVILVVAADDGIMPQTVEAIHHAKAAGVPIIVAVNKMDKPEADLGRVERGLMEHGLISEKLGGDTMILPVSAKTRQGIDELLEMILLQSEVLELKANPNRKAVGTIIEARLDRGRGPVATVVIEEGTLRAGDIIVAGTTFGKVRALIDALGQKIKEAPPSKPVEVLGLTEVPMASDKIYATSTEEDARRIADHRVDKVRDARHQASAPTRLEDLYAQAMKGEIPELRVIIKVDVQGSIEALRDVVSKLSTEKVKVSVLHSGVGAVTESDVMLAVASRAIIVGFNVRPDSKARELAEHEKIQIRLYNIIYEVVDDVKKAMEGMLKPTYQEKYLGRAEVRQTFSISKIGTIAGCQVIDGKILRTASVRLIRDGKVVYQGKISSLKRFKEDAREIPSGTECGISIENYNDIKTGDVIEAFIVEEIAGKL